MANQKTVINVGRHLQTNNYVYMPTPHYLKGFGDSRFSTIPNVDISYNTVPRSPADPLGATIRIPSYSAAGKLINNEGMQYVSVDMYQAYFSYNTIVKNFRDEYDAKENIIITNKDGYGFNKQKGVGVNTVNNVLQFITNNTVQITLNAVNCTMKNGLYVAGTLTINGNLTTDGTVTWYNGSVSSASTLTNALSTISGVTANTYYHTLLQKQSIGVIADEIEPTMPSSVVSTDDGTKAVTYSDLFSYAGAALQEQDSQLSNIVEKRS